MVRAGGDARRAQLARLLNERRLELHRMSVPARWADVASAGGISAEALRALRHDGAGVRDLTLSGTEKGLQLAPGSIRAFLDGHADALPAATPPPPPGPDLYGWVSARMTTRGASGAQVLEFAGHMGWRGGTAPAAEDLTIREWEAIGAQVGLPLEKAVAEWRKAAARPSAGGGSGASRGLVSPIA